MRPTWQEAILMSYAQFPEGRAINQDIYRTVGRFKALTASHMRPQWDGRPAFQHQVRSHISDLCDRGDLIALGVDLHQITPQGKKRVSN
jgi:hypothetical protein